jgi:hypothetical protein
VIAEIAVLTTPLPLDKAANISRNILLKVLTSANMSSVPTCPLQPAVTFLTCRFFSKLTAAAHYANTLKSASKSIRSVFDDFRVDEIKAQISRD